MVNGVSLARPVMPVWAVAAALLVLLPLPGGTPAWGQDAGKNQKEKAGKAQPRDEVGKTGARSKGGKRGRRGRRGRRGPALVEVDAVRRGPVVESMPVYGRVVATQVGAVAARTKGAIEKVSVKVGDRVAKGDVLVTLVADMLRSERALQAAELAEYKAKVGTARVQMKLARQELARIEKLRSSSAFSRARFQDKQRDVERAKSLLGESLAKIEQSRAELAMADLNLAYTRIRAPFAGVVSERHVEVGAYVNVGQKAVTLINDRALEVEAEVPASRIAGLGETTAVTVNPEIGKPFKAKVRAVVPVENPMARTRTVRFVPEVNGVALRLASNQSVIVAIPKGLPREALSLHKDAVVHRGGRPVVFVFDKGAAVLRGVKLGEAFGTRFEVLDGVHAGEMVVVRGNERLRDGQPLRTKNSGEAGRKGPGEGGRKGRRGGGE